MKSRTSFFNKAALRKDILRYSPIWALYTIFLLLVLFGEVDYSRATIARDVMDLLKGMAWINWIYGGICGVFLFMDLFNSRLCNALHAFPVRRESWLTTHILSGFLFSFVPNLLVTGIGALLLWEYAYIAPIWLAISTMQFLFFFGTAVLAATCAGNILGTVAVYGIAHFITVFVYAVAELLYQPLLHGVKFSGKAFYRFFPLDQLDGFEYVDFKMLYENVKPAFQYNGLEWEGWLYVGICAAVGVLAFFLACLVYCRRNLETAGDFISLKPLSPLFLLVCTLGAGVFLYMFSDLLGNRTYLFLVLGMIIGYLAGSMLLNRTLKVFGKRSLLSLAVLLVVFGGTLLVTWLDPMGLTSVVPKAENIETVYIYGADKGYYYLAESSLFGDFGYEEEDGFEITDGEEIGKLQDFHRQLIDCRPSDDDGTLCDVQIRYKLTNGRTVARYYEVGRNTLLGKQAGEYFSDMRYIFEVSDTKILYDAFESVYMDCWEDGINMEMKLTEQQDIAELLDAIAADCAAGTMAQNWAFHTEPGKDTGYYIEFYVKDTMFDQGNWRSSRFHLQVYEDSHNTLSYLKEKLTAKGEIIQ